MILDGKEMLYAGVLSSGVAFLLQIYGQQNLSPAPVAIIFSLEGVFASIFGWIILSQFLNEIKIIGIIGVIINHKRKYIPFRRMANNFSIFLLLLINLL